MMWFYAVSWDNEMGSWGIHEKVFTSREDAEAMIESMKSEDGESSVEYAVWPMCIKESK